MVPKSRLKRLSLTATSVPAAALVGIVFAILTAALFGLMPRSVIEALILKSGVPAVLAAAEPPLGFNARLILTLGGAGVMGTIAWFSVYLMVGGRAVSIGIGRSSATDLPDVPVLRRADAHPDVPVLRRADAHPDAPARAPLFANRDLGTPFLEVRARTLAKEGSAPPREPAPPEPAPPAPAMPTRSLPMPPIDEQPPVPEPRPLPIRGVPADLDQPMAAFDPNAISSTPMAPPAPPPPSLVTQFRPQVIDPGERFETFELTPIVRNDAGGRATVPARRPSVDTRATLTALLERLERGVSERAAPPVPPKEGLADTLGSLRRLATRG